MAPIANEEVREHGLTKSEFGVIWQSIRLKATDEYTVPPEILQVNGSTIGTLGNFSASTGKAKSKKTFNVSAIVAAALSNSEVLRYTAAFPEDKRKVLYIDTEQSKYHCQKVLKRILQLQDFLQIKIVQISYSWLFVNNHQNSVVPLLTICSTR